jgi:5-methylcytosine-specific restriction protein A
MPGRPKSICRAPGCGKVIDAPGHCEAHKKAVQRQQDERRGTAYERGYDNKWTKARAAYLRKHPLCVYCQMLNRLAAATVVDHIEPHRLKDAMDSGDKHRIARARYLFWDADNNWASLCGSCHNTVAQSCERNGTRKPWAKATRPD